MTDVDRSPEPNFDRVARAYRWMEYLALGPLLQQARTCFIAQLPVCRQAVVLGDGDGRFLASLLVHQPKLRALAVDTSSTMLSLLRQRCKHAGARLQTLHTSALGVDVPAGTDLIATHFFLDCLTQAEVDELTQRFAVQLDPGALWLVSDFGTVRSAVLRPFAALYVRALYLAFRVLTGLRVNRLPNSQAAFHRSGFERIATKDRLFGFIYAELWRKSAGSPVEYDFDAKES